MIDPAALAAHYTRFRVAERVLLTGHSHQAWPDVAFDGQMQAIADAAEHVDDKWAHAEAKAERVRDGFRALLGESRAEIALGASTHELVVRMLSAFELGRRPRVVTTTGEFHTLRRQLGRIAEAGIEVVRVEAEPVDTLAARIVAAVTRDTAAVLMSSVLFGSSRIVPDVAAVAEACAHHDVELVLDVYHHLGAVPFDTTGLADAWIVGGGYKYLQLGEGNCFLRLPPHADNLRPEITGWFAEFDGLSDPTRPGATAYGRGALRWAGATYDPTSHYRAARVFDFFVEQQLTPDALRATSLRQTARIAQRLGLDDDRADYGGFVALPSPRAAQLRDALKEAGMHTDVRGDTLRLGPAPYVTDAQIDDAADRLTAMMR